MGWSSLRRDGEGDIRLPSPPASGRIWRRHSQTLPGVLNGRVKGNGQQLQYSKLHQDKRRKFFIMKVVLH